VKMSVMGIMCIAKSVAGKCHQIIITLTERKRSMRKCKNCEYFSTNKIEQTVCKRYPEAIYKSESDWCGEFKQKSNKNFDFVIEDDRVVSLETIVTPTVSDISDTETSKKRGRPKSKQAEV